MRSQMIPVHAHPSEIRSIFVIKVYHNHRPFAGPLLLLKPPKILNVILESKKIKMEVIGMPVNGRLYYRVSDYVKHAPM